MRHGNDLSVQQSEREEPLFAVGFARVFGSHCIAGKYLLCVCEVNAMIIEVLLAFVTFWVDNGVLGGHTYRYFVRPCAATGKRGQRSNTATVEVPAPSYVAAE